MPRRAAFEIDPLPAVVGVDQAVADATLLFEEAGTNVVAVDTTGDDEVDLTQWPVQVDVTVDHQRLAPLSIEPLSIPFEGTVIKAWLQKPDGVARPPITINIGGSDLWKDSVAIQARSPAAYTPVIARRSASTKESAKSCHIASVRL